ncbi:hypothetical protein [Microbacterium saperdae]|uniref:Uncharacterized protein n=1 Tax=Microbacterium saperdae TaxID=69368 RepID=A0A543BAX6_9MICO|nr:hypothetical protein [Microbacterium saperdae]TQL81999.1 hypothetical protein FB560_3481 [Microbacterium saperdae]GGM36406.1 hypothetical protein GCM10010489_04180 [Microbacterium saperdae]
MQSRRWPAIAVQAAGLLAAALAATWTIAHLISVTVHAPSQLRDVAFGWPIPWYHQDLSRYQPADYPTTVEIVGDRVDPVPTTVDWLALAGDVALTALALWAIVAALLHLLGPALRRRLAGREAQKH